jgi:voltage-gated potassium channel
MAEAWKRLWIGFVLVVLVISIGTVGFHVLGSMNGLEWSWLDCVYMTVITVSTVGYGEILPIQHLPEARIFTIAIILFGMGMLVYFASAVVALVVEFDVREVIQRRKRLKAIQELQGHVIVCGIGTTGIHVVEELRSIGTPFVVVESDRERIMHVQTHLGTEFLFVVGDATDDDVLEEAGIARAQGVVSALSNDKDNLFVTITARQLNPKARIVSRAKESSSSNKLKRAGADAVVSPNLIGGMRMASEMVRPMVVQFLDVMLRDTEKTLRIEEATVPEYSMVDGKRLMDTQIRKITELLVVAVRSPDGVYKYAPGPDFVLRAGATLIVLGDSKDVVKLRKYLGER